MPTITPTNVTSPISTIQPTIPTQVTQVTRDRFAANLAKIEANQQQTSQAQNPVTQATPSLTENSPLDVNDINRVQGEKTAPQAIPVKAPDNVDERIASMARKEKAAWAQVNALKQEKALLEKAREGRMTKDEFFNSLSAEELAQVAINKNTPVDSTVAALKAELSALRVEQEAFKKSQEDNVASSYAQALKQIDFEAKSLVDTNDAYEVTRSQGAHAAVTKLIELTYHETGELMDVRAAAAQIEAELEREALDLYSRSTKLKAKLSPPQTSTAPSAQDATKQPIQTAQPRTLTHGMSQASSNNTLNRRDRAIAAFQGRLK